MMHVFFKKQQQYGVKDYKVSIKMREKSWAENLA